MSGKTLPLEIPAFFEGIHGFHIELQKSKPCDSQYKTPYLHPSKIINSMKFKFTLLAALLFASSFSYAQKKNEAFEYHIRKASSPVKVDGMGGDAAWQSTEVATDFYQVLPMDTGKALVRTEVRMLYDDKNLYLLAINYEKMDGPYMVESLRRDFSFGKNDNFLLFLDPFDDQTNGFTFGATHGAPNGTAYSMRAARPT